MRELESLIIRAYEIQGVLAIDNSFNRVGFDHVLLVMRVAEEPPYSAGYLDPSERSIANAVQVHFNDGTSTDSVEVVYPIGHPRRRAEALPRLRRKLQANLATAFDAERVSEAALTHPGVGFEIVFGVSDAVWPLYDLDPGRRAIGYHPQERRELTEQADTSPRFRG